MGDISDCMQQLSSSTEFKKALKVLIKYEINCLLKRLSDTGEEAFVITTSVDDGLQGHLGTVKGEGFLQAENTGQTLKEKFIEFCTDSGVLRETKDVYRSERPVDFSQKIHFLPTRISCSKPTDEISSYEKDLSSRILRNEDVTGHREMETTSTAVKKSSLTNGHTLLPQLTSDCESLYFQETEEGVICEASKLRKMFEEKDVGSHNHGKGDRETSQNSSDRFSWSLVRHRGENDKLETDNQKSCQENCKQQKDDFYYHKMKKELEPENPINKEINVLKHCKRDGKISKYNMEADNLEQEACKVKSFNSSFYSKIHKAKQHAAWKMIDEFPHFSYHGNDGSPSDMEYLNQCYFRGMTNEHEGELLDFSIKKECQSKPESCQNSVHTDSVSYMDISFNSSHMLGQDLSTNGRFRSPDGADISDRFVFKNNTWEGSGTEFIEPGEAPCDDRNRAECAVGSRTDNSNVELLNIKSEPCEAMNLKVEPGSAPVKIEPGAANLNYAVMDNSTKRDRKTNKFVSSELSPPLTMHLNFSCKICGQVFKNRQYRDFHVKAHGSSCQYFCSLCSKGFHSETDYKKHLNEHTEPLFQCETCGYRCTREFRMRAHKEICGSPNKVYKCPFCHKQFAAQRYMRIHIKSHDAQNIHTCPICQNTYPLKNSLLKHMKKKHGQVQN